jgi:hypothetical protein
MLVTRAITFNPLDEICTVDNHMPCRVVPMGQPTPAPFANPPDFPPIQTQFGRKLRCAVICWQNKFRPREECW